jgi:hypothetical protein
MNELMPFIIIMLVMAFVIAVEIYVANYYSPAMEIVANSRARHDAHRSVKVRQKRRTSTGMTCACATVECGKLKLIESKTEAERG